MEEKKKKFTQWQANGRNLVLSLLAPITIILLWYVSTNNGWVKTSILPTPQKVVNTFWTMVTSGKLARDLSISVLRVARGFSLGLSCGVVIGALMGFSKTINQIINPLVSVLRPIPMLAWIPMLILWLGIGEESKTAVIFIGSFWPSLLNTIQGILNTDEKLLEEARILEKSHWCLITEVYLPSALPSVFTGIRLGMSSAWTCVVGAEMIAATSGIGYMIHYARELAQPARILAGVFCIGGIGLLIDRGVLYLQHRLLSWAYTEKR